MHVSGASNDVDVSRVNNIMETWMYKYCRFSNVDSSGANYTVDVSGVNITKM
jgi:hypothetical protein